ncbi:HEAT repeat domain-containing protein [Blastococcus sp. LR1]|uniref:HEAT repeat domain-containing protein n=1 Tax=Blastococcus sp. LR1 TaxID=2877000 RepID=UPI001CCBFBED|nr:hypothetical protein [Blastococcus sp. LR1]MCA0145066.1 hypothetical protein [Blastococcus sp. LR1]
MTSPGWGGDWGDPSLRRRDHHAGALLMGSRGDKDVDTFMAELAADPEYQQRRQAIDAEHTRLVGINRAASAPLAAELRALGYAVEFPEDLYSYDYRTAVPVLIDWLPRIDNPDVKASIARALAVGWARPIAAQPLVREYAAVLGKGGVQNEMLRFDFANALDVVADSTVADDLMRFVADDRTEDDARSALLSALGHAGSATVARFVADQLSDDASPLVLVGGLVALRRLGDPTTRPTVDRYVSHPHRDVRREAVRTAKSLDRAGHRKRTAE